MCYNHFDPQSILSIVRLHDDVMPWKHFSHYRPFERRIHRSPINSPHEGPITQALMFSLMLAQTNGWINRRDSGHLICHVAYCGVTAMRKYIIWQHTAPIPLVMINSRQCTPWWRHQMETFSALLALCAGNSPVPGAFPAQMPVTRSFDVFFDLRLNKRLSKQSWGRWFETPLGPLWRQCNGEIDHLTTYGTDTIGYGKQSIYAI